MRRNVVLYCPGCKRHKVFRFLKDDIVSHFYECIVSKDVIREMRNFEEERRLN